jgi:4-amino-4-deoxy-L-arabinose transferase-like glycosyltransferase
MKWRRGSYFVPLLLACATAALYLPGLQDAPIYPVRDEMYFALNAHSLAASGRDSHGLWLPVYFPIGPLERPIMWFQPMLMYATALVVRVLPFTEATIRLPMAALGILDVVLMYLVAKLLFGRERFAITAAVLLALTPAHFIYSRCALDYQASLPFILGWLLCVLRYCREARPARLFMAGLVLGAGLYSYIGAYVWMPFYGLLTGVVIYKRREPVARYALLAAGFMLPAAFGLIVLWQHPEIIHDVLTRYDPAQQTSVGIAGTVQGFVHTRRLDEAVAVYSTFWNTQLLFIDGRMMLTGVAGVFLFAIAGALVVGVARAVLHRSAAAILMLGGLLAGPFPASFVNTPEVIYRGLAVLPFVVLLAVYGLEYISSASSARTRRLAFVAMWCVMIALAAAQREHLPYAQAFIRAATVPLALAGLATLLRRADIDGLGIGQTGLLAVLSLGAIQAVYYAAGYAVVLMATLVIFTAIGLATVLQWSIADRARFGPQIAIALLAFLASEFVYFYVDYSFVHRIAFIPAGAMLILVRLVCSGAVLAAAIGLARASRSAMTHGLSAAQQLLLASLLLAAIDLAYFHIDVFLDYRLRYLYVSAVLLSAIGFAMAGPRLAVARLRLGGLATVVLLTLVSIQFTVFYRDYFDGFRMRRSADPEARVTLAYDVLLRRLNDASVPVVYLGTNLDVPWLGDPDLFWRFYLLKHDRPDLLSRTIFANSSELDAGRVHQLAAGSIVVATVSPATNTTIDRMVWAGELKADTLVKSVAGVPMFWIGERTSPGVQ